MIWSPSGHLQRIWRKQKDPTSCKWDLISLLCPPMLFRYRCSGCGWTPGRTPHHQEQDVRPHHRVPRRRRGACVRLVDKLLVLPEHLDDAKGHFGENSDQGLGWNWFSLSFPSCPPPGSDGHCWADHHGHGEGRATQGREYKEDLDGRLQGADRQGASSHVFFLFNHEQFKNKAVGIGVKKKKKTEERDTGMK